MLKFLILFFIGYAAYRFLRLLLRSQGGKEMSVGGKQRSDTTDLQIDKDDIEDAEFKDIP